MAHDIERAALRRRADGSTVERGEQLTLQADGGVYVFNTTWSYRFNTISVTNPRGNNVIMLADAFDCDVTYETVRL